MAKIVWERSALSDLNEIIRYIERFDPTAADRIGIALFDLGESLANFPRRGRSAGSDARELTTVQPFILRYTVEEDRVTILSIRHSARRPLDQP